MDSWRPSASIALLQRRAAVLAQIRQFFAGRSILEVTTPSLSTAATTEPAIASLSVNSSMRPDACWYLHSSPELAMKRLLAADSGAIYQICTVYRDSDCGHQHRPEFTMLEWYRPNWAYQQLMQELQDLLLTLAATHEPIAVNRYTYRELFLQYLQLDPFHTDAQACQRVCRQHDIAVPESMDDTLDPWLDILLSFCITPQLQDNSLTYIYDYPASQAALAKIVCSEGVEVAQRFELYWGSVELANGFQELTDANEQRHRFQQENNLRQQRGLPVVPIDERFLQAMQHGLPECSGVAVGVDRLLMCLLACDDISQVCAFDEFSS